MNEYIIKRIFIPDVPVILLKRKPGYYCCLPYHGHKNGCPNFDKADRCPPFAPLYKENSVFTLAAVRFDIVRWAARMRAAHPRWSDMQCSNCYYWQKTVLKELSEWACIQLAGSIRQRPEAPISIK